MQMYCNYKINNWIMANHPKIAILGDDTDQGVIFRIYPCLLPAKKNNGEYEDDAIWNVDDYNVFKKIGLKNPNKPGKSGGGSKKKAVVWIH